MRAAPVAIAPSTTTTTPLVDRGDDVVAVARSLLLFGRRLEGDHPDPAMVDRVYAWGSRIERGVRADVSYLRRSGARVVEVDAAPPELVVVSRLPNVVSFRVTEHLDHRELVDGHGRVVDQVGPATEQYLVLMRRGSVSDPWRLSAVERQSPRVEVRL